MNEVVEQTSDQEPLAELTASKPVPKKEKAQQGQLTVDVYQIDSEIIIKSTIAGIKGEDLDISITNDMVTIKGRREQEEKINSGQYYYQELFWGDFSRAIILPEEIDADKATATLKNGILTINLPKISKSKERKVRVAS